MNKGLTVRQVLERVFPDRGSSAPPYYVWPVQPSHKNRSRNRVKDRHDLGIYAIPPLVPFDVFAVAAHLMELSGGYHHISYELDGMPRGRDGREKTKSPRIYQVTRKQISECRSISKIWRDEWEPANSPEAFTELIEKRFRALEGLERRWQDLFATYGDQPVYGRLGSDEPHPVWWRTAHELMMIADEASVGVGYATLDSSLWFERLAVSPYWEPEQHETMFSKPVGIPSLSSADMNVLCVLPKARTTPVGCTLRSLSHHLALLPPQGIARGWWYSPASDPVMTDNVELNLLLIPFPFTIPDAAFHGTQTRAEPLAASGYFEVEQLWLGEHGREPAPQRFSDLMVAFVIDLVLAARKEHGASSIDAVVFPELALDWSLFVTLTEQLKSRLPELELIISGLSDDHEDRTGNFVAVGVYQKDSAELACEYYIREKHHRWRLDRSQLETYGLTGQLNPKFQWWEDIDLLGRRIDFTTFRRRSVLAAMICEDLARVDPCQELLRSIGPNLVVALLMDAPQLPTRWAARYATVLAEDPGCSVLTLTSRGLMTRQHQHETWKSCKPSDRAIALWRDDFHGAPIAIACPHDCQGVWLKLWSSGVTDFALDGREDTHGKTWIYGKHRALKLPEADEKYRDILGDADCALREEGDTA